MNSLKELREQSGRKQVDVATEAGITREYLSILENGRGRPSPKLAERLAAIYGVPPWTVMGYAVPEESGSLQDERKQIWGRLEQSNEEHAREMQAKQREVDLLQARIERLQHDLDHSQAMLEMLMKKFNSLPIAVTDEENS